MCTFFTLIFADIIWQSHTTSHPEQCPPIHTRYYLYAIIGFFTNRIRHSESNSFEIRSLRLYICMARFINWTGIVLYFALHIHSYVFLLDNPFIFARKKCKFSHFININEYIADYVAVSEYIHSTCRLTKSHELG